ncbi:unnamed protein product [Chrysoparadoxa australica]
MAPSHEERNNTQASAMSSYSAMSKWQVKHGTSATVLKLDVPGETQTKTRLLGVPISHFGDTVQFLLIASMAIGSNLAYGLLQEHLVVNVFERRLALYMSWLQTACVAAMSYGHLVLLREHRERRIPLRAYVLVGTCHAAAISLGNLGMMRLNFASKVLFKSTKAVPIMLWGVLFLRKRYRLRDYLTVGLMVLGLVLFLGADVTSKAHFSMLGVVFMLGCLVADCCYSNTSEHMMKVYEGTPEEAMFYTFAASALVQLHTCAISGELSGGTRWLVYEGGWSSFPALFCYVFFGYAGANGITCLTKHFGALNATLASSTRKVLNLSLSFLLFPKPFTVQHACGEAPPHHPSCTEPMHESLHYLLNCHVPSLWIGIFVAGLLGKSLQKHAKEPPGAARCRVLSLGDEDTDELTAADISMSSAGGFSSPEPTRAGKSVAVRLSPMSVLSSMTHRFRAHSSSRSSGGNGELGTDLV